MCANVIFASVLSCAVLNRSFDWADEMEAVAKHDFQATADDELSFYRGAKLKVGQHLERN